MENCKNPATELCITVGINAFPLLQWKTSHVLLLAVYHVCDYTSLMSLVMFSGKGTVSYHRATLPESQYKLVCLIFVQYFG